MKMGITGHQRLEDEGSWEWVRSELARIFTQETQSLEAFSSLAIGADQEFATIAIEHGARLHVIVPCSGYEGTFKTDSDLARYRYLLSKSAGVDLLDYSEPSEEAFMAAGKKIADNVDLLVAVWNGKETAGTGGTDDAVEYAVEHGTRVLHINPVSREVVPLARE